MEKDSSKTNTSSPIIDTGAPKPNMNASKTNSWYRRRNALIFFPIVALWIVIDLASKAYFDTFAPGQVVAGPFFGIFEFMLVHNTGAAWGMFDNATIALGVLSLAVCVFLTIYLFAGAPRTGRVATLGLALVVAGGIGNAIDRFMQGYVVDFIAPVFIDFPVFNVADIGVTCGFAIFIIAIVVQWVRERKHGHEGEENAQTPDAGNFKNER